MNATIAASTIVISVAAAGVDLPAVVELVPHDDRRHDDQDEEAGQGKAENAHIGQERRVLTRLMAVTILPNPLSVKDLA